MIAWRMRDFGLGLLLGGLLVLGLVLPALVSGQISIVGGLTGAGITPISTAVAGVGTFGSVSVGTSATSVLAANTNRLTVTVCNNGSATVYLGIGSSAASVVTGSAGTALSGAPISLNGCKTLDRYTGIIYAISGSAAQDVRYEEYTTQ